MSNLLLRIQALAESEGITITALERSLGASKGVISRAIKYGTDIQAKWVCIIVENYPHISADWLLKGEGSMVKQSPSNDNNQINDKLLSIIKDKAEAIRQQAEEIGSLKQRIQDLTRRLEKSADAASTNHTANAG